MIDLHPYEMEVHLVHSCNDESLVVYGIFFEIYHAATNRDVDDLSLWLESALGVHFEDWPQVIHTQQQITRTIDLYEVVDRNSLVYMYEGSLTTPPCSEIVSWNIQKKVRNIEVSQAIDFVDRIAQNSRDHYSSNNRAIQDMNGRKVYVG
eukprot:CFRG4125T1